jgi:DNA-binding Lrp family transcriptional regulator
MNFEINKIKFYTNTKASFIIKQTWKYWTNWYYYYCKELEKDGRIIPAISVSILKNIEIMMVHQRINRLIEQGILRNKTCDQWKKVGYDWGSLQELRWIKIRSQIDYWRTEVILEITEWLLHTDRFTLYIKKHKDQWTHAKSPLWKNWYYSRHCQTDSIIELLCFQKKCFL